MFNVAIKSLLAHKLRMSLTALAIILGVGFISGTYVFTDSISKTFDGIFEDAFAGIDVTVRGELPDSGFSEVESALVSQDILTQVEAVEGVENAIGVAEGFAAPINKDGEIIGGNGPPNLGFSWVDVPELNQVIIKDGNGRAPQAAGEFVLDANTVNNNGFAVGDTVQVQTFGPAEDFELVGIVSFGEADTLAGATISLFEISEAQRLFGLEDNFSAINITAVEGFSPEQVRDNVAAVLDEGFEAVTGDQQTQEQQADINEGLGFINTALLSFAAVAVFVGAFIIQNTFRIVISQRSKELALLRAVGATRSQIIRMVLIEALLVSIVASIIGIIYGIAISYAIRGIANGAGLGLPEGELALLPRTVIVSLIVGVVVTMFSALLPARKASKVTPIEALRENEASAQNRSLLVRGIISSIGFLIGLAVMMFGLFGDIANPIYYVGAGVLAMFIGISAFAPILSGPLGALIGWPFQKARGMSGLLAQQNIRRTPRRTAATASALMIGVALVVFVSIFATSVKGTIDKVIVESFGADLLLTTSSPDPTQTISRQIGEDLAELDEVGVLSRVFLDQVTIDDQLQPLIAGIEPEGFDTTIRLKPSSDYATMEPRDIFVNQTFAETHEYSIGDSVEIAFSSEKTDMFTIVGTFEEAFDANVVMRYDQLDDFYVRRTGDSWIAVVFNRDFSPEDARLAIEGVADGFPTVTVQNVGELVEEAKSQIDSLLALFWGLLGLAIVIAVLGITNTLTLSIAERTREIGLLRAVGMTKQKVRTMVRIESVIISLFGAILGMIMGTFFAWAILKALEDDGLTNFIIDPVQIAVFFVLAAIAGILASILPAFNAARVDILKAINFE